MAGFLGPGDPGSLDEFLARFFGPGARGPVRRIDLTRLMSAGARELVATAAQLAIDRGDPDLDAQHLLLASTRIEPTRHWLTRAGVDPDEIATITDLLLGETRRRLAAQEVSVEFTPATVRRLSELGYQPEFGARPLRRTIQREVDNRLSGLLLAGKLPAGTHVKVDTHNGRLDITPVG